MRWAEAVTPTRPAGLCGIPKCSLPAANCSQCQRACRQSACRRPHAGARGLDERARAGFACLFSAAWFPPAHQHRRRDAHTRPPTHSPYRQAGGDSSEAYQSAATALRTFLSDWVHVLDPGGGRLAVGSCSTSLGRFTLGVGRGQGRWPSGWRLSCPTSRSSQPASWCRSSPCVANELLHSVVVQRLAPAVLRHTAPCILIHVPPQAPPCRCWRHTAAWTSCCKPQSC